MPQAVLASQTLQKHEGFWLTEGSPNTAPKPLEFTTVSYNTGSDGRRVSQILLQRRAGRRFRERRPAPKPALVKETIKTHRVRSFFDFYQKHDAFAIGNSKNTLKHEVSDVQLRPNLVHSDSKLCFPRLVHASRPPSFEFPMLSGSWAPKALQT